MAKENLLCVPSKIKELVDTYETHIEAYRSQQYNETQLRREFLDPFFIALGWDVTNTAGYAHAYKDVIHEDAIKIGSATKAPDYCFRIGGVRKFFLEAKKPSINIKDDPHPAYQLRRYAWSAKLPLSILTDFEEFAVYDCQIRPKQHDMSDTARIMYFTYKDYFDKWDEIAGIFARESILKGSFDKYAASTKGKRGTTTVDIEFLNEIEKWRDMLAKIIARRNQLSTGEINFCVQRTIDRILFLRMCEDRGIEEYGQLLKISTGERNYKRLCEVFEKADQKYNSGLFHFHEEKERHESPDTLSPNIEIDDKDLKWILHNLYYPQSPYEFSVLPAEILGNVYEQFLGKVIRLTSPNQAKVEDKPEVKKAGGVYYTPSYIVDYIVKNTIGKLMGAPVIAASDSSCHSRAGGNPKKEQPLTPRQIANIKILDPACGSGSFLLGAFSFLLDYHRDWYVANDPQKHTKQLYQGKAGQWFLNIAEKKRILLNNIYGVDIDSQAVEVTKLSLLLKVLEDENAQTIESQYRLFHERVLPDLADNIKCGNSLIAPDFFGNGWQPQAKLGDGFHAQDLHDKINAFDWKAEFPQIFSTKNPGFDIVIGNPPYIGFHGFNVGKEYLKTHFVSASGKFDIYLPFIEKGIILLKADGLFAYICPTNFMKRAHGQELRSFLSKNITIEQICDFHDIQIFSGPTNYTGIFIFRNNTPTSDHCLLYKSRTLEDKGINIPQISASHNPWIFRNKIDNELVQKLSYQNAIPLGKLVSGISEGIVTGQNSVFLLDIENPVFQSLESYLLRLCIRGKEIQRYCISPIKSAVLYPYRLEREKTVVIPENELREFRNTYQYFSTKRKALQGRSYFDESSKLWYELWCQRSLSILEKEKIVTPELSDRNRFAIADKTQFYGDTVCGITLLETTNENLYYLLGVLNSLLIEFYYKNTTVPKAGGFYIYKTMFLKNIPIRTIDFDNRDDKAMHDKLVNLVEQMLDLHKRLSAAKIPSDKTKIQRQIDSTDKQIDTLVYKLYNLTDDEIKIVEGNTSK